MRRQILFLTLAFSLIFLLSIDNSIISKAYAMTSIYAVWDDEDIDLHLLKLNAQYHLHLILYN